MNRRTVLGMITAAAALPSTAAVRDQFIGVWKLVSMERKAPDGTLTHPYGDAPIGRITYDRSGRMSAQLMRPGRGHASLTPASSSTDALRTASNEDLREMVNGFSAYFGTFDVDEGRKTVIHHVQAALLPSWVGTDLKRTYEFSGNRLTLRVASASSLTLVWEKEKD
jgi:hypothetical protein